MCDLNSNLSTLTDDKTASLVAEIPSDGSILQIDSALLHIFLQVQINIDLSLSEGGIF